MTGPSLALQQAALQEAEGVRATLPAPPEVGVAGATLPAAAAEPGTRDLVAELAGRGDARPSLLVGAADVAVPDGLAGLPGGSFQ